MKRKAPTSKPTRANTTLLSKRSLTLKRTATHYVMPLTVVAKGSVAEHQLEAALPVPVTANRLIANSSCAPEPTTTDAILFMQKAALALAAREPQL